MKTMTCRQLGGACDLEFHADTFDELAELSKRHGMEMLQKQDAAHLRAMEKMRAMAGDPEAMQRWMADKKRLFDTLPDDT